MHTETTDIQTLEQKHLNWLSEEELKVSFKFSAEKLKNRQLVPRGRKHTEQLSMFCNLYMESEFNLNLILRV